MRHFILFLVLVFSSVFVGLYLKKQESQVATSVPQLRVYGTSSFVSQWGPGPWLKQEFEKNCQCQVVFVDSQDTISLIQRVKTEPRVQAADVVLGLDQFELELSQKGFEWRSHKFNAQDFTAEMRTWFQNPSFVPYNYGVLAFVGRTSEVSPMPRSFDDLLQERFRNQVSLPDPRTSSLGYQLLLWLKEVRGESGAFDFLRKFLKQVKMISPGWSLSYGIFQKKQALLTLSYVTSPIYHLLEEKTTEVVALEFQEGHPMQVEFAGVPASCRNCELADRFLTLLLSPIGQKILMEKNYMFPVLESVRREGVFAQVPNYKLLPRNPLPSSQERETLLKSWTHLRRSLE